MSFPKADAVKENNSADFQRSGDFAPKFFISGARCASRQGRWIFAGLLAVTFAGMSFAAEPKTQLDGKGDSPNAPAKSAATAAATSAPSAAAATPTPSGVAQPTPSPAAPKPTPTPSSSPSPAVSATPKQPYKPSGPPPAPDASVWPWGEPFEVVVPGDILIRGMYKAKRRERTTTIVLISPDKNSYVEAFRLLGARLAGKGFGIAAFDCRGVGMSQNTTDGGKYDLSKNYNSAEPYKAMVKDVEKVIGYLQKEKKLRPSEFVLVGAGVSANVAILAAADLETEVRSVVALSPGANYHYLEPLAAAPKLGGRPLLAVASGKDSISFTFLNLLKHNYKSTEILTLGGNKHGHEMLDFDSVTKIVEWLEKN